MIQRLVAADEHDVLGEAWIVTIVDMAHLEYAGAQELVGLLFSQAPDGVRMTSKGRKGVIGCWGEATVQVK